MKKLNVKFNCLLQKQTHQCQEQKGMRAAAAFCRLLIVYRMPQPKKTDLMKRKQKENKEAHKLKRF